MERLKYPERKHLIEGEVSHPFSRLPKVALGLIKTLPSLKTEGGGWVCDLPSSPPPHGPAILKSRTKAMCEIKASLAFLILGPNKVLGAASVSKSMWLWFQQWACAMCPFRDVKSAAAFTVTKTMDASS